jgi:probable HAF family extracellular repeat protein
MMKLEDLLVHDSGWKRLIIAEDINNRGQIVGFGETDSGEDHAFLMTPVPGPVGE